MPPDASRSLQDNFKLGLHYLKLALEQLSNHEPKTSDDLRNAHLVKLESMYEFHIQRLNYEESHLVHEDHHSSFSSYGLRPSEALQPPRYPPGFEHDIYSKMSPSHKSISNENIEPTSLNLYGPGPVITSEPASFSFGVIGGERKAAGGQNTSSMGSRTEHKLRAWNEPGTTPKSSGYKGFLFTPSESPNGVKKTGDTASRTGLREGIHDLNQSALQETQRNSKPSTVSSTWAKVAAITPVAPKSYGPFNGHMKSTRSTTNIKTAVQAAIDKEEPLEQQQRVIWVTGLSSADSMHKVSSQITQGPVMSILIQTNVCEALPGKSACVIFQHAEHAQMLIEARDQLPGHYHLVSGTAFPADEDIQLMNGPIFARRRLKWSRSRLFYDVSLVRFKNDVLEMCGAANIELFHFYNPGEATVVFASVKVATHVLNRFRALKDSSIRGRPSPYAGVDIGYVHDFNEAPAKLFSQYGQDFKVRKFANEAGVEGLFSGPAVPGCTV